MLCVVNHCTCTAQWFTTRVLSRILKLMGVVCVCVHVCAGGGGEILGVGPAGIAHNLLEWV